MPTAKSVRKDGEIDLITFVGNIFKYEEFDFDRELEAIKISNYDNYLKEISDNYYSFMRASDFRALIVHEQTHFLDLTATFWGIEYNLRKIRVLDEITTERVEVFKLNYSELQCMHNEYNISFENFSYKDVESFKHIYEYSEKFGVLLFIILTDKNGIQKKVPVTILSLFEGHAFSNEELRRINDIKIITNREVKSKFIDFIEKEYYSYLNDINNHEYNILLILSTIHMERFGLKRKEILAFFSAVAGFTFNLYSSGISILANRIFEYIGSKLKYCVKADLCRNQLRHILAFHTILRSYEFINHPYNRHKKKYLIDLVKKQPLFFIFNMWDKISGEELNKYRFLDEIEMPMYLKMFDEYNYDKTKEVFKRSAENSKKFKNNNYVLHNLDDYYLLDMYRDYLKYDIKPENRIIRFSKSIDINIEEYFEEDEEHLLLSCLVDDEVFKKTNKFHLDLEGAINLDLESRKQALLNPDTVFNIIFT
ncbi:hypothetical protein VXO67_11015 [Acinetobacter baumannii]|uniref:hypothetical protein n=1 Tax=Acinetobacter baumannii TaxID=470 RepID=UPI002AF8EDA5|nr:hypothetical protein [Acinetobacter baumannii]